MLLKMLGSEPVDKMQMGKTVKVLDICSVAFGSETWCSSQFNFVGVLGSIDVRLCLTFFASVLVSTSLSVGLSSFLSISRSLRLTDRQ